MVLTMSGMHVSRMRFMRGTGIWMLDRDFEALIAQLEAVRDEWCHEESCRYRRWRSGSIPTHKRGGDCPENSVVPVVSSTTTKGS